MRLVRLAPAASAEGREKPTAAATTARSTSQDDNDGGTDTTGKPNIKTNADENAKRSRTNDSTGDPADGSVIAESRSRVDNIEHLYFTELPAGRYRLEIRRKDQLTEAWDYGLAWRFGR